VREPRAVIDVGPEEAVLLFGGRVGGRVAGVGGCGIVVVVRPFREVVGEFEAGEVGARVLKVDDDELLVLVGWLEERGFLVVRPDTEDVAILGL
jgi:hypothetical protein